MRKEQIVAPDDEIEREATLHTDISESSSPVKADVKTDYEQWVDTKVIPEPNSMRGTKTEL